MYQPVPSLTPWFHTFLSPGYRVFTYQSLPRGRQGFESGKCSTFLNENVKFSLCFKETNGSEQSRCSCDIVILHFAKYSGVILIRKTTFCYFDDTFRSSKGYLCWCEMIIKIWIQTGYCFHDFCPNFLSCFPLILENICPGMGRFFLPHGQWFCTFFVPWGRKFAHLKIFLGSGPEGGWSGLELTDI